MIIKDLKKKIIIIIINQIKKDKIKMLFLLKCPKCSHEMKYDSKGLISEKNKKRCVYCGFSMQARRSILKKL